MADESSSAAPTNFAEFEAGGGTYKPAPVSEAAKPAAAAEEPSEAPGAESVAEPETAEKPIQENKPVKKPPAPAGTKPKLSLSDEHAKLLKEVTELRAQRRELQQPPTTSQPAPQAGAAAKPEPAAEEKPPARPKLSTFAGTLDEYEAAVDKYEEEQRKWQDRQYEKRESDRQAKAEREKIAASYGAKVAEHVKEHPEYDEEIAQTPLSPLMAEIVFHNGPELGQKLIENKDEARRISALQRDVQIFEMGKLAAAQNGNGHHSTIPESATETDEAEEESAPKPVKIPAKLGASGGSSQVNKPGHGAKNFAEFEAIEQRLRAKKRG